MNGMGKLLFTAFVAGGLSAVCLAAPDDVVTQADLKALIDRISQLESENRAQAKRIAELEKRAMSPIAAACGDDAESALHAEVDGGIATMRRIDDGERMTATNGSGRVYTTAQGYKYYLADKMAGIFEPLSESGLKITPYGYLIFEAIHNTHKTAVDAYSDWVLPRKNGRHNGDHQTCFTMEDSMLGIQFETPEAVNGWTFVGRAEFDFAVEHANDYQLHWRHLYVNAEHDSGWSILFGQTWHLWKMVTPNEIDGAWMENTGHPYRRSPQIRVTKKWAWEDSALEARVGLVKNGPGMGGDRDGDENEDNSASAWALVEGAVVYEHKAPWATKDGNRRWLVGVGGMYGRDKSHRPTGVDAYGDWIYGGTGDEYDSSMIMFAGSIPFGDFTLCGQIFGGENLGGVQAGIGQRVGYDGLYRKGRGVRTVGGFVDLKWEFNDDWEFAVGYGFDNPNDKDARCAERRTFNDRAYVDVFYKITSNFRICLEYARLTTKYYADGDGRDDRFEFAAFYDF